MHEDDENPGGGEAPHPVDTERGAGVWADIPGDKMFLGTLRRTLRRERGCGDVYEFTVVAQPGVRVAVTVDQEALPYSGAPESYAE
jgi:hypothetical protein